MKLDVKITNLGKFEAGTIKVRPVTVLTGPNGTGKSFITKTLYSLLNVVNRNVFHVRVSKDIRDIQLRLEAQIRLLGDTDEESLRLLNELKAGLNIIQFELDSAAQWTVTEYLDFAQTQVDAIQDDSIKELANSFSEYFVSKNNSPASQSILDALEKLVTHLGDSKKAYLKMQIASFTNEMRESFQITNLPDLISFGKDRCRLIIEDSSSIMFDKGGMGFDLKPAFINQVSSLSRVVFFESPAYWKVRDALQSAKAQAQSQAFNDQSQNNVLTGVPKYFYDLDQALRTKVKGDGSNKIGELASVIKDELGGEFVFNGDNLVFKDNESGKEVSKNLMSFGMVNLGMIHALLKNNVITKGSFIFLDEPETNLHPNWQVLLMNTLIRLAEHEVNVVITTHSVNMIKALEVWVKKHQGEKGEVSDDFIGIHFLDTDGTLMDFESEDVLSQLIEARSELSSAYTDLYFDEYANA